MPDFVDPNWHEYTTPEERDRRGKVEEPFFELRTKTDDSDWSEWRNPASQTAIQDSVIPTLLDYPLTVSVTVCKDIGLGHRLWTEYRIKS